MKRRLQEVEASIERYLERLAEADPAEPARDEAQSLQDKVAALREELQRLKKLQVRMLEAPEKQVSLTDPDARSMNARGSGIVTYNAQSKVNSRHHLIIAHEVSNVVSDRRQLSRLADAARDVMATETLEVVADRGYDNGDEIRPCEEAGIRT